LIEGDIVIAVNKDFTQNLQRYKTAIQSTGDRLQLIIQRDGQLIQYTLKVKNILKRYRLR
jgi:hypothetical protein